MTVSLKDLLCLFETHARRRGRSRSDTLLVMHDALRERYGDATVDQIVRRARNHAEVSTEARESATETLSPLSYALILDVARLRQTDDLEAAIRLVPAFGGDIPVERRRGEVLITMVRARSADPNRAADFVVIVETDYADGSIIVNYRDSWTFSRRETATLFAQNMRNAGYRRVRIVRQPRMALR